MNRRINIHEIVLMYGNIQSIFPKNTSNKLVPEPISMASTFTVAPPTISMSSQTALIRTFSKTETAETSGISCNPTTASATDAKPPSISSTIPKIAEKIFPSMGEITPFDHVVKRSSCLKKPVFATLCKHPRLDTTGFDRLRFYPCETAMFHGNLGVFCETSSTKVNSRAHREESGAFGCFTCLT